MLARLELEEWRPGSFFGKNLNYVDFGDGENLNGQPIDVYDGDHLVAPLLLSVLGSCTSNGIIGGSGRLKQSESNH